MAKMDIGAAIDRLRIARKLNKKELAEASGIDAGNLNRIISGQQQPTIERLEQLADAFGIRVSDIIRLAETGQPEDKRKEALMQIIDQLDSQQLDTYFRRWPDGDDKPHGEPVRGKARKKSG